MFTKTTLFHKPGEGGGSGGDQHNLGWYATPEALRTAHATASDGDWAIVGSTDTVWVWDSDTTAWVDTGAAGITQIQSDWNQTDTTAVDYIKNKPSVPSNVVPAVSFNSVLYATSTTGQQTQIDYSDSTAAGTIPIRDSQGRLRAATPSSSTHVANKDYVDGLVTGKQDVFQYTTMPTASADNVGDIVQFVGTTTASYINGYFYKCVSDGADPATYSWEAVEVQASSGGSSYTAGTGIDITNDVISVTAPTLQNTATNTADYLCIFGQNNGVGVGICGDVSSGNVGGVAIGGGIINYRAGASGNYGAIAIGRTASASGSGTVAIGRDATASSNMSVAIGYLAKTETASYAIQLGYGTNSTANTFSVGLGTNNNYRLLDSNGTIPAARHADTTNASQGDVLALDSNGNPVWQTTSAVDPHRVIDFQAPTAQNNYTWYRKYADGWVEQGGVYTGSVSAGNSVAITLAVTMSDANYTLNITGEQNSNNYSYAVIKDGSKTTTGFYLFAGGASSGDSIKAACWQVSGMAA